MILAGGTATRLDGADKSALALDGRSLLERALAAVEHADETVVVGAAVATTRPVTFTRETPPGGGPLAGLSAGVAALAGAADLVVVLAVDMPHVSRQTIDRLVAAVGDADGSWLVDAGGRRQLAGVVRRGLVPSTADAPGLPMRRLMDRVGVVDVPATGREAEDIDTWDDVARLGGAT